MNKQLHIELNYSKRMKSNIILTNILDDITSSLYYDMIWAVRSYKSGNYYESKQKRVKSLPSDEEIVNNILTIILSSDTIKPIQGPATELGIVLGYKNPLDAVKTGAELLSLTHGELFDIELSPDGTDIIPKLQIDSNTRDMIDNLQYLPPMQQKPNDWISNTDGGWLWERKSIILGKGNHHYGQQAYDVLNLMQDIPWTIDIPTYVNHENPNENMDIAQFDGVVTESLGQPFYFVWRYDKRGRSYSSGYDLNIQSNEYGKSMISLHNKQSVTNLSNLKIAIANHAGHDKMTWQGRIDWFNKQTVFDIDTFAEPILGAKALRAYHETKQGHKTGYVMSIDATASGLQIMSALSGCKDTARVCNMINTGNREDVYQMIADKMNVLLNGKYSVNRKDVKKPCMTTLHQWELPDGHIARVPVTEMTDVRVEIDELDHRTFTYRYNRQQPSENFRSLVANIVHSVDGFVAREMIRRCDTEIVHIHDCFVFSPDQLQLVCRTYRKILAEIADMDLLSDILSEISGEYVPVEKLSNDLSTDILASEYMLS